MLGPMPVEDQSCILKSEKLSRRKKWKILNAFLSPRRVFLIISLCGGQVVF